MNTQQGSTRFKCGKCGSPVTANGRPMKMSEIGLTKHLALWDDAALLPGQCCFPGDTYGKLLAEGAVPVPDGVESPEEFVAWVEGQAEKMAQADQ